MRISTHKCRSVEQLRLAHFELLEAVVLSEGFRISDRQGRNELVSPRDCVDAVDGPPSCGGTVPTIVLARWQNTPSRANASQRAQFGKSLIWLGLQDTEDCREAASV